MVFNCFGMLVAEIVSAPQGIPLITLLIFSLSLYPLGFMLGSNCGACWCGGACEILKITYDWTGSSSKDLDTSTRFLGKTAGWACSGNGDLYIVWNGDMTGSSSSEFLLILVKASLAAKLWSGSTTVNLSAGWYIPAGGTGPAKVIVSCHDIPGALEPQEKQINPGRQSSCASTNVGSITINEDCTFTLN